MKAALHLKLTQQLTLTPQLQQAIRLLQLSTLELNQEISEMLQDNPFLEEASEEATGEEGASEWDSEEEALSSSVEEWEHASHGAQGEEALSPEFSLPVELSLRSHLFSQLDELILTDRDKILVTILIDSLDDQGFLTQSLEDLGTMLASESVEPEELTTALKLLQQFEPLGVGARSLGECLHLQLSALSPSREGRKVALELVLQHLDLLAHRDFTRLRRVLHCSESELKQAIDLIQTLNPHPAAAFGQGEIHYIVPDIFVRKIKGRWCARLNQSALPRLAIHADYAALIQRNREESVLAGQLQQAKWLIRNVQQRFETILRVSEVIVERQQAFFNEGEVAMRPLVLRDIAEELGLHESTISRVTTHKYLHSPRGVFELKYFFGSHVETDTGGSCSATAIKALIRQLIAAESPKKPLSDSALSHLLGDQGIVVARRTVAKYREALLIPPVNQRKSL